MKKQLCVLMFGYMVFSLSNNSFAGEAQQIQMLNSQIQAQLQQMQETQQKQIADLNTQVQGQLKKMKDELSAQIATLNTNYQADLKKMQNDLQAQIKQVQSDVVKAK
jgi:t-SNARE complex subunit (syntaxin)